MGLIPAKCSQCGSALTVDSTQENIICPFCSTPFILQKEIVINNYNTARNAGESKGVETVEELVKAGETFLKLKDYLSAKNAFTKITERYPFENRGWWGLIRVMSEEFTKYNCTRQYLYSIKERYDKFVAVSQKNISAQKEQFIQYYGQHMQILDDLCVKAERELTTVHDEYERERQRLSPMIEQLCDKKNKTREFGAVAYVPFGLISIFLIIPKLLFSDFALLQIFSIAIGTAFTSLFGTIGMLVINKVQRKKWNKLHAQEKQYTEALEQLKAKCDHRQAELILLRDQTKR